MLRMSLRDPRVPSRLRCDVGSVACKLQYPRDSQHTQLGIATSEYRSPRWICVFAVARHLEAHRVEAAVLTSIRCFATKAEPRERRANVLVTKMVANP